MPRRSGNGQALFNLARFDLVVSAAVLCVLCSASAAAGSHIADINLAAPEIISVASGEADDGRGQRYGSLEGGTRLWVRGISFSHEPGGNLLFIDGVRCDVIEFLTTSSVIVADTPPLADRSKVGQALSIDVLVDGKRRGTTGRTFIYHPNRTPQLDAVYPRAASAGSTLSLVGVLRGGRSAAEFRSIDVGPARCLPVAGGLLTTTRPTLVDIESPLSLSSSASASAHLHEHPP
jgi:hypothetical protein